MGKNIWTTAKSGVVTDTTSNVNHFKRQSAGSVRGPYYIYRNN